MCDEQVLYQVFVGSYSVARAAVYWLPCCWLEGEVEPAVATVAADQKAGEVAGCSGEEVEGASYPLEEGADLWWGKNSAVCFLASLNDLHSSTHIEELVNTF